MSLVKRSHQAGDTIIEVLIAVAIIGMILGGAYATANTSSQIVRQAQERSDAIKVAEMQLETVRSINADIDSAGDRETMYSGSDFCWSSGGYMYEYTSSIPAYEDSEDVSDEMPSDCNYNNHYYAHVSHDGSGDKSRFTVTVRWNRLGGGVDEVVMAYGLYEAEAN